MPICSLVAISGVTGDIYPSFPCYKPESTLPASACCGSSV